MIEELKKENIKLSDWEFEGQQRGEQTILLCDLFGKAFSSKFIFGITGFQENYNYLFTDSNRLYKDSRLAKKSIEKLKENIKDKVFLKNILESSLSVPKSFNRVADEIEEAMKNESITNFELGVLWEKMDESFIDVIPWFFYPWYISKENWLTDKIKEKLEKYKNEIEGITSLDGALFAIIFPIKKTAFQLEQEDMLCLVRIAKQNENFPDTQLFRDVACKYLKRYDWLTTFLLNPLHSMSYEELEQRVRRALTENFEGNFIDQRSVLQKNKEMAEKILEIIRNDKELLEDIAAARELGFALTAGVEEAYRASARYLSFIRLVATRMAIAYEEIKYLLSEEIVKMLKEEIEVSQNEIKTRKQGFVMMIQSGKQTALFGEKGHALSMWLDKTLNAVDKNLKELKGSIACKGSAIGRVRLASQPSEAHLLEVGEVLVCPMTNPDYVPAMRRSVAIITDEGGLLSHAAIMSREFGKPCIIGTKIATQVLKDGDLVEVDADRGIVTILERGPEDTRGADNGIVKILR